MIKHRWKTRKNKRINAAYADKYSIRSMVSLLYRFQYISSAYRAIQILGIKTSLDKQKNNNRWSWNYVKGDLEKNAFSIEKTYSQFLSPTFICTIKSATGRIFKSFALTISSTGPTFDKRVEINSRRANIFNHFYNMLTTIIART